MTLYIGLSLFNVSSCSGYCRKIAVVSKSIIVLAIISTIINLHSLAEISLLHS